MSNSGFFSNRHMFAVHMLQVFLVLLALGGSAMRLLVVKAPGAPRSRANTMALGMGAKSLIIITYQILSHKYNKWVSLKAYMILNSLEVVFWAAVAFMMIQVNLKFCMGTNCILSWAVCGVGGTLSAVAAWTAVVLSRIGITSRQMDIIVEPRLPLRTILLRMDAHSNELTLKGNRH